MNTFFRKGFLGLNKEQINKYAFPILLAVSVAFACLYTFHKPSAYVLSVVFFFASALLFRLFDKLKSKKNGALIYALILAVVFFISFSLVVLHVASFGPFSFMRWFYAQDDVDSFQPDLIAALFLGGGFFLISVIYYFSSIRYRTLGVMLCTLFPFFIFAKRSDTMPNILTTLIMLLFLAVIIHNKRIRRPEKNERPSLLQIDRAYIICISVFILIVGALTMAVEKPYYQAFLEKNSRLFTPFGVSVQGSANYEELSEQSSPRNGQPSYTYEPMFYFETDSDSDEIFLRTKAFSHFDGDYWTNPESGGYIYYSKQLPEYSTDDIVSDMAVLTGRNSEGLYYVHNGYLSDEDFSPFYLPSPYGIITDDMPTNLLKYLKLSSDTSVWRRGSYYYAYPLDDRFTFTEADFALYKKAEEYNFNSDEYIEFLNSKDNSEEAKRLSDDYSNALRDYTDLTGISERLKALSLEITKDCHSDMEKAEKLEGYFSSNGFMYSLEYVPDDASIDYFVFESKTGYCVGYATAMTLMARAAGLPARYVEGFAAFEKNESSQFVIRDGYAHAFVEIYIPGAGWLTFDPTVSQYREIPNTNQSQANFGFLTRIFSLFNRISVVIVIAVIVLFFSLLDRIKELFLRISLLFKPINERIIRLYSNVIKVVGNSVNGDFSAYTPDMLREYLLSERGAVPEQLISLFEKTAFGGYNCSKQEFKSAYKEYRKCYKLLRRPLRKSKK